MCRNFQGKWKHRWAPFFLPSFSLASQTLVGTNSNILHPPCSTTFPVLAFPCGPILPNMHTPEVSLQGGSHLATPYRKPQPGPAPLKSDTVTGRKSNNNDLAS